MKQIALLCLLIFGVRASILQAGRRFPDKFIFGVSSAAYQIEGAWNEDGKTESIWDHLVHTNPGAIEDGSNADVACDSYRKYKRDVEMMRELGIDAYRMSLSWPRILPTGYPNTINKAGIEFYDNYINEMLKYNITPIVTIYHWDLPQSLQDLGGMSNPLFADWFEDYARVVFQLFGDRVKMWITFNEPKQICFDGYSAATKAPMLKTHGFGEYLCAKNTIMANARAYHLYNREFRAKQGGKLGYSVDVGWYSAETDSAEDRIAAELKRQAEWALYSDPIFSEEGGWPKDLADRIASKSASQGYSRSRLPEFTPEEKKYVHGTADFYGVNHYTSYKVSATKNLFNHPVPSLLDDINVGLVKPDDWANSVFGTMPRGPDCIFNILKQLHQRYPNTVFYITESGTATTPELEDDDRVQLYRDNFESALNALDEGIPLKGYLAWSLMDNFEWISGYKLRFGLYYVDFNDPARPRTPRKSAFVFKHINKHRMVDHGYEPTGTGMIMTIDDSRHGPEYTMHYDDSLKQGENIAKLS